ncbi:MAG: DUF2585 family protein [Chthoniobacterales bacterium]
MSSRDRLFVGLAIGLAVAVAVIEWGMGRLPLGPDGRFGLWEGDIWSSGCSQRVADMYSFSHIIHGMAFYGLLWLVARKLPLSVRFLIAVAIEAGWELLENSPIIINRYREATMALGYEGDSILNSFFDIVMMGIGFALAWKLRPPITIILVLVMELGCLFMIRDNLTLNIIMLLHPVETIKNWQMEGRALPDNDAAGVWMHHFEGEFSEYNSFRNTATRRPPCTSFCRVMSRALMT